MGSFANSLFKILLGWVQGTAAAVWSAFTNKDGGTFFEWIGRHWILIACILCVTGAAADLCVYLFRWKPYKVLKSYFARKRGTADGELYSRTATEQTAGTGVTKQEQISGPKNRPVSRPSCEPYAEPDLSHWETEPESIARDSEEAVPEPDTVTRSGYVVPADSPYRRPAERIRAKAEDENGTAAGTGREEPTPIAPRRRRKIKVTDLFTDPEEELRQFDAPQHVIDSRKAYHDPVYPHGWKKNEEDGE